ncbi:MAG: phosphate propanoyltransferase [Clostridia bacterium]|nr:phosphate propanoyltransferase [Clostridia bacterium]
MSEKKIIVEMSARHVHVTESDLEILFGKGASLTPKRELSQPGQYLCEERVDLIGPKKTIANVSILGPTRPETQVEVSLTDARTLGVSAPIRMSGDVKGSGAVTIKGPVGEVTLTEGVIAAKRHIHMTPEDAQKMNLKDGQTVSVKIGGERGLVFDETVLRVSKKFATAMHIDTDEANAVALPRDAVGVILD